MGRWEIRAWGGAAPWHLASGALLGMLVYASACTGRVGPVGGDVSSAGAAGDRPPEGAPLATDEPIDGEVDRVDPLDEVQAQRCSPSVGPAPLRRLSHAEYQGSLRALFPSVDFPTPQVLHDPDEHGFENRAKNLNPVLQLVEQYGAAAESIGAAIAADLSSVVPCAPADETQEAACAEQFIAEFGQQVFRRPLSEEEQQDYAAFFEQERAASDFEGAVQLTVEVLLQSPQFLYRLELGDTASEESDRVQLSAYEIATRIAFLLAGRTPDEALLEAAALGALASPEGREAEARRLLADSQAAEMMIEFHRQWLDFDRLAEEPKDPERYPEYDEALQNAIRAESDRFVEQVFWAGDGTLEAFLTSTRTQVNEPLAQLYGVEVEDTGWQEVELDSQERAGWLTRANFLASRAHKLEGSPPLRSVYVLEKFFCLEPPDPPDDADLSEPRGEAGAEPGTNRELFEQRIAPATCQSCHSQLDTIGYGLEHYDAIGRYRATDNGYDVDARGELKNTDIDGTFTGGVELSHKLVESDQVRTCVAENWFEYALGREIAPEDECRFAKLNLALAEADGDIREMLVAWVKSPEFIYRPPLER